MKRIFGIVLSLFLFSSLAFSQERKVEVWDFGGVPQEGAVNHISIADLDSFEAIDETGKFTAGTYTFSGEEPFNEWLASQISKRLGFYYCNYFVEWTDKTKLISKCENFVSEDEEIISAL